MAKPARLNVYVTPAGFYDAVVAAPNQKAALKAWGARSDLFAEKLAGSETDPFWRDMALASPGEVLRKPRGNAAALLAQPSPAKPKRGAKPRAQVAPKPPQKPTPNRTKLNAAEAALEKAQAEVERIAADFSRRRQELEAAEQSATKRAQTMLARAESVRKREHEAFARAPRR